MFKNPFAKDNSDPTENHSFVSDKPTVKINLAFIFAFGLICFSLHKDEEKL